MRKTGLQFLKGIQSYKEAYRFTKKNRIWEGLTTKYWIKLILLVSILLVSLNTVVVISSFINGSLNSSITMNGNSDFSQIYNQIFSSGIKYLILIVLEVVIFHCSVVTLNILTKSDKYPTFMEFLRAQYRMFIVVLRSWILEIIFTILISILLSVFGLSSLKFFFVFIIQMFFIGFAFMDNYSEQYNVTIRESTKIIFDNKGATLAIGLVTYLLLFIPIIGVVVGPVLGAVASTLYLYNDGVLISRKRDWTEV